MSSVKHGQKNRDGRPAKSRKTTFEMQSGKHGHSNKTSHNKKKLACSTAVHCNVMLLARSENKLWFIHQKPRARRSSHLLSRYPIMRAVHLRIFVGPMCTFDPQQSEDKVQMTPAQRRTRFRCLRRSRRGLQKKKKNFVGRSQQNKTHEQNRHNGLTKFCVRQHSESTQTLAQHCERKTTCQTNSALTLRDHTCSSAQYTLLCQNRH